MANRWGKSRSNDNFFFSLGCKISVNHNRSHEIKRHLLLGKKALTNLDSILKSRHHFADKGPYSQSYWFSSSHIQMWELNHKEIWVLKNWCFQTVMLEKTLESPLDCKEIKPVNLKDFSPEYSLEGLLLKLKLQYFCHLMWRVDSLEKPWCQKRLKAKDNKAAEDEMFR